MARYRRIPLEQLFVDPDYQRPLNENRIIKMAEKYDVRKLGTLEVSERVDPDTGDITYAVFDGQHRLMMLALLEHKDAPCLVHEGLTPEEEAQLFVELQQERKAVQPFDRFRAQVFYKDERAIAIKKAVEAAGFRVVQGSSPRYIKAIGVLESIFERGGGLEGGGGPHLTRVLGYAAPWTVDNEPIHGAVFDGISVFITKYGGLYDDATLKRKLALTPPDVLVRRTAQALRSFGGGGSRATLMAQEILRVYNTGKRGKRIMPPEDGSVAA